MKINISNNKVVEVRFDYETEEQEDAIIYTGKTFCTIKLDNLEFKDESRCHPSDQFTKRIGRKIAFERTLFKSPISREDRFIMWRKLFNV